MLPHIVKLGSFRSSVNFVHQNQHDVPSTGMDRRPDGCDDPIITGPLRLGTTNARKAQSRCDRYLPPWTSDSPFWDRKAHYLLPQYSLGRIG